MTSLLEKRLVELDTFSKILEPLLRNHINSHTPQQLNMADQLQQTLEIMPEDYFEDSNDEVESLQRENIKQLEKDHHQSKDENQQQQNQPPVTTPAIKKSRKSTNSSSGKEPAKKKIMMDEEDNEQSTSAAEDNSTGGSLG